VIGRHHNRQSPIANHQFADGLMRRLAIFISTCGYVGYAPVAPGTFGSAAGLAVFFAVRSTGSSFAEIAAIVVLFAVGIWAGTVAEHHFGGVDPGPIVLDEVVGMLITLFLLPVNGLGAFIGFLVFRVLDVIKPFPSASFEKLPGGLGVMADDAMAAIYGNLMMWGLMFVMPGLRA
jgi:phosphatidylglycerophosphatase A